MNEQSNLKRHQHCPMRTHVGNCIIIGGFCTSIREDICDALHKSFQMGTRSRAVDKANDDAISREHLLNYLKTLELAYDGPGGTKLKISSELIYPVLETIITEFPSIASRLDTRGEVE